MENNKGQSTIEFIMTFSIIFAFFFLFLKMAMNYTDGYMVQHATYLASRSYMAVDNDTDSPEASNNDAKALQHAKTVFKKYLPDGLINNFDGQFFVNNPGDKLAPFTGGYAEYTTAFSLGIIGGKERMTMRSEAFLGREPTRYESAFQVCVAIKSVTGSTCNVQTTLEDNGG